MHPEVDRPARPTQPHNAQLRRYHCDQEEEAIREDCWVRLSKLPMGQEKPKAKKAKAKKKERDSRHSTQTYHFRNNGNNLDDVDEEAGQRHSRSRTRAYPAEGDTETQRSRMRAVGAALLICATVLLLVPNSDAIIPESLHPSLALARTALGTAEADRTELRDPQL